MRAVRLPRCGQEVERFFRFGMVGLSVTLLYTGGYAALRGLGAVPWAASAMAFTVAVVWQYLAQTLWTFRAGLADRARLARFGATISAGLAVSTTLTGLIGPVLGLPEVVTILIVILWLPFQNYMIFRFWVYRDAVAGATVGPVSNFSKPTGFKHTDRSAQRAPRSVLDVGCGRGVWLAGWRDRGAEDVAGIDGGYVDRADLAIPAERFVEADLARPVALGRRFDLVQCLEVGEHLPPVASDALVETLVGHGDVIAFSAAVPGQGGENHINERPLEFWRARFRAHGYAAFDAVRPRLARERAIEPWYRYNLVLYANAVGADRLPEDVAACRVPEDVVLHEAGDLRWRLRRAVVRRLPRAAVDAIARRRAAALAMLHHARAGRA